MYKIIMYNFFYLYYYLSTYLFIADKVFVDGSFFCNSTPPYSFCKKIMTLSPPILNEHPTQNAKFRSLYNHHKCWKYRCKEKQIQYEQKPQKTTLRTSHISSNTYTQASILQSWWSTVTATLHTLFTSSSSNCLTCSQPKEYTQSLVVSDIEQFYIVTLGSYTEQNLKLNVCKKPTHRHHLDRNQQIYTTVTKHRNASLSLDITETITPKRSIPKQIPIESWWYSLFRVMKLTCKLPKVYISLDTHHTIPLSDHSLNDSSVINTFQSNKSSDKCNQTVVSTKYLMQSVTTVSTKEIPTTFTKELTFTVTKEVPVSVEYTLTSHKEVKVYSTKTVTEEIPTTITLKEISTVLQDVTVVKESPVTIYSEVPVTLTKETTHTETHKQTHTKEIEHTVTQENIKTETQQITTTLLKEIPTKIVETSHVWLTETITSTSTQLSTTTVTEKPTVPILKESPAEIVKETVYVTQQTIATGTSYVNPIPLVISIPQATVKDTMADKKVVSLRTTYGKLKMIWYHSQQRAGYVDDSFMLYLLFCGLLLQIVKNYIPRFRSNRPTIIIPPPPVTVPNVTPPPPVIIPNVVFDQVDSVKGIQDIPIKATPQNTVKNGTKLLPTPAAVIAARKKLELELVVAVVDIGPYSTFSSNLKM